MIQTKSTKSGWYFECVSLSAIHSKYFGNLFFLTLIVGSGNAGNPKRKHLERHESLRSMVMFKKPEEIKPP